MREGSVTGAAGAGSARRRRKVTGRAEGLSAWGLRRPWLNEWPQPQVDVALGFLIANPPPIRSSL